jgi:hypothetical protein
MDAPVSIIRENIVFAVERRAVTASSNVYHACWPSEFPLTVCGAIATENLWRELPRRGKMGSDCPDCLHLIECGAVLARQNPHLT